MKKLKQFIVVFACVFSLVLNARATSNKTIAWNGKLDRGVSSMGYWISSSCEYTASIPKAVNNWMYPGWSNPINLYSVSKSNSNMDFYQINSSSSRANATTKVYKQGGAVVTVSQKNNTNWRYGEITLNEAYMGKRSSNENIGTIVHEMGHVFGLRDINNRNSIMHYSGDKLVRRVTKDANDAIVRKYR